MGVVVGSGPPGRQFAALVVVVCLAAACVSAAPSVAPSAQLSSAAAAPSPLRGPTQATATTAAPSPVRTPTATPADLSARPLTWFAPLPPMPGRTGSADFMDQFTVDAPWTKAAAHINVYKLYGEWVAYDATDEQLRQAVRGIADRGMLLAVEAGPLDPASDCGTGVESFAGVSEGRRIAERILAAGGRIDVVALDEPYFFANVYAGAGACHWPLARIAAGVVAYRDAMRQVFPQVLIGDTEPLPEPVAADGIAAWLDAYRSVAGEPFAFLHLDADWSRAGWTTLAHQVADAAHARGVPIGMIYDGGSTTGRSAWIAQAGERVKAYEAAGNPPDHVVFQSWMAQPDRVLPDSDPTSFSGLVARYFDAHGSLGFATTGVGANLGLGRPARASATLAGSPPSAAVDGDFDTLWSSGSGAPQWVEVDLGSARTIAGIRLTVSQYPAGPTDHQVYGRVRDGSLVLLHSFKGTTQDGMVLAFTPEHPWTGLYAIRILTNASPSWIAWKEIEILAP